MLFAELTYTLATEEAERIGVDHVARMTATGTGENSTGNHSCNKTTLLFAMQYLLLTHQQSYLKDGQSACMPLAPFFSFSKQITYFMLVMAYKSSS